jgi:hypothetical protein
MRCIRKSAILTLLLALRCDAACHTDGQETVLHNEIRSTEVYLANWEKKSSAMFRWQCGILALLTIGTYLMCGMHQASRRSRYRKACISVLI